MSDEKPASALNASMKPLPEGYPYIEVACQCKGVGPCRTCNGKGFYYEYKRIKGQYLADEMNQKNSDLGEKPNW